MSLRICLAAVLALGAFTASTSAAGFLQGGRPDTDAAFDKLKHSVIVTKAFKDKVVSACHKSDRQETCISDATDRLFCHLLERSNKDMAARHFSAGCDRPATMRTAEGHDSRSVTPIAPRPMQMVAKAASPPVPAATLAAIKARICSTEDFKQQTLKLSTVMGCQSVKKSGNCQEYVQEASFCLAFADQMARFANVTGARDEETYCKHIDEKMPQLALLLQGHAKPRGLIQVQSHSQLSKAPEDDLAKEMTHDLEMNFNKIAPFGKEDTAKELQDHAAKTQDTLVDAVENAEVAEIKRAVFRALTRLRAATIKEFDTIARLETQAIDAYNDAHHYRAENPLAHLHEDEAPVETDKLKSFH